MLTELGWVHMGVGPCQTEAPSSCQTSLTSTLHPSSFFPELSPLFPLSPGLQMPPQSPYHVKQSPSVNINPPRMPRGRDAIHFNQPTLYTDLSPTLMDHLSILLCSIKIPCDLLKLHMLISSALALYIWDPSVWGSHSQQAVFQSVLKGVDFLESSGVCPRLLTSLWNKTLFSSTLSLAVCSAGCLAPWEVTLPVLPGSLSFLRRVWEFTESGFCLKWRRT